MQLRGAARLPLVALAAAAAIAVAGCTGGSPAAPAARAADVEPVARDEPRPAATIEDAAESPPLAAHEPAAEPPAPPVDAPTATATVAPEAGQQGHHAPTRATATPASATPAPTAPAVSAEPTPAPTPDATPTAPPSAPEPVTGAPVPPVAPQAEAFDASRAFSGAQFPSLNDPRVLTREQATWLEGDDLVLGAVQNGASRAYPLSMLAFHHIVNDQLGGKPYLVTF